MSELPEEFRLRFDNIKLNYEQLPDKEMGVPPDVYGWCGRETDSSDGALHPLLRPCEVTLFQRNLERVAPDRLTLKEEIGKTVMHEVGHRFGMDHDTLGSLSVH